MLLHVGRKGSAERQQGARMIRIDGRNFTPCLSGYFVAV